jgi:hypothetical protein
MRSRAVSFPREAVLLERLSPPAARDLCERSRSSATSASIRARRSSKASDVSIRS